MSQPEIVILREPSDGSPERPSAAVTVAAVSAIIAAWLAAGSAGLLAHAFRRSLVWTALAVMVAAAWPRGRNAGWRILLLAAGIIAAVAMAAPRLPASNILAVVVVLGVLAVGRARADRQALLLAAFAVTALGLYRHANTSIPFLWLTTDAAGQTLGRAAGRITGLPLWVGSTFGGIDFLVVMLALGMGWVFLARPRWSVAAVMVVAVIAAQFVYLCTLTLAAGLLDALPRHAGASTRVASRAVWLASAPAWTSVILVVFLLALYLAWVIGRRPTWSRGVAVLAVGLVIHLICMCVLAYARDLAAALPTPLDPARKVWPPRSEWWLADSVRTLIPWNMPLIGCALHALAAAVMFRLPGRPAPPGKRVPYLGHALLAGTVLLAAILPLLGTLSPAKLSLEGKKVVVYKKGFLNWLKPKFDNYGRLAIGMYGTLPAHIESLGGECLISPKLSAADLKDADVLILLFPDDRWNESKVKQIRTSVESGELVLLLPEEKVYGRKDPASRFRRSVLKGNVETVVPEGAWGENTKQLDEVQKLLNDGKLVALVSDGGDVEGGVVRVKELVKSGKFVSFAADDDWDQARGQLERISEFIKGGKTLLVFGEHTSVVTKGTDGETGGPVATVGDVVAWAHTPTWMRTWAEYSAFNEVLQPTAMRVVFDSATFEVGGWLQSYDALAHPSTTGLPDDYNEFGVVIGASMSARRPAKPLLVGRWGWGDPGDPAAGRSMMGNHIYDPGERLGDILLAAEQRIGKGRVIAFGDTSSMTNGISTGSYKFTSRLMAYAAGTPGGPHDTWRGVFGVLAALALVALLAWRPSPARVIAPAIVFAVSLAVCTGISYRAGAILPDGRGKILRDGSEYFSDNNAKTPRAAAKVASKEAGQAAGELRAKIRALVANEEKVTNTILPAFVDWVVSTAHNRTKPDADPAVVSQVRVPPHAEASVKEAVRRLGALRTRVLAIGRSGGVAEPLLPDFVERIVSAAIERNPGELPVNNLAYIDGLHLEAFSSESWRMDGTMGITLTLMRDGYIVRDLEEFTPDRLMRAGLVLSIAPGRAFTWAERKAVREFVEGGGIFIITVGHDDVAPSRRLLADFGLFVGLEFPYEGDYVPRFDIAAKTVGREKKNEEAHTHARGSEGAAPAAPAAPPPPKPPKKAPDPFGRRLVLKKHIREPEPMGHFKRQYTCVKTPKEHYHPYVRYDAGWYVNHVLYDGATTDDFEVIGTGVRRITRLGYGIPVPMILVRRFGKGKFVLVGDTGFAMNKNLEVEGGWAFEGKRENPYFWRWFLAKLRGRKPWLPPNEQAKKADAHDHAEDKK